MSTVYLYIRKPCSMGTLVLNIDREEALEIIETFIGSQYQVGIFAAKNIEVLRKIYAEFAPFKEAESKEYIIEILKGKNEDKSLETIKDKRLPDLYSLAKAKLKSKKIDIEKDIYAEVTEEEIKILDFIPYSDLQKKGYVKKIRKRDMQSKIEKVREIRKLCNISNIENITDKLVACRTQQSMTGSVEALAVWLKIGENKAKNMRVNNFDKEKLKLLIPEFRKMTFKNQNDFHYELVQSCAECGVKVILVEKLTNTNVIGATQWIDNKPVIQLTLKGKRADSFWFTFLHEVAHILIHDNKDFHMQEDCKLELEDEADKNARNWLIPDKEYNRFTFNNSNKIITINSINKFSKEIGIHPSIVIGRLQYEKKLEWNMYNEYIPKVKII